MKKILFIITLGVLSINAFGQSYVSLATCNNDPLKYIERNYQDNAAYYKGKTIGSWADQCELNLTQYKYIPCKYSPWTEDKSMVDYIEAIRIDVNFTENSTNYSYYIYIYIDESTPRKWDEECKLDTNYDAYWEKKYYDFYKTAKIKKIRIGKKINGEYKKDYRRP